VSHQFNDGHSAELEHKCDGGVRVFDHDRNHCGVEATECNMQPGHASYVKLSTAHSAILFELCELQQARDTKDLIPGTWWIGMRGMHERFLFMSHRGDDYMDGCMKE